MSVLAADFIRTWIADNIVPEPLAEHRGAEALKPFVDQLISDAEEAGITQDELDEENLDLEDLIAEAMDGRDEAGPVDEGDVA